MALFQTEPRSRASKPPEWLNSRETARWLAAHSAKKSVRQRGGLLLEIDAYGPHHAVAQAAEVLDRFSARVVVGTRSEAVFFPTVVVKGFPDCGELRPSRMLEVRALERENRVYDLTRAGPIDAALELLSHLESGSSAPAVAGGWSAIEVLLTGPGDDGNVQAANRLASLVACSFPRAELTDLAWSWSRTSDDPIATAIQEAETNRERARVIADAITDQHGFAFPSNSDTAALDRIEKVLGNPRQQLREIRDHVIESFRRLYRQRNLVMHGGRTEAVALDASLRTAAPLVGAGVDRIVHGYLTKRLEPLQLYAQSEVEMDRAGTSAGCHLVDLLE